MLAILSLPQWVFTSGKASFNERQFEPSVAIQWDRNLIIRFQEFSKLSDCMSRFPYHTEIWQMFGQQCCHDKHQNSRWLFDWGGWEQILIYMYFVYFSIIILRMHGRSALNFGIFMYLVFLLFRFPSCFIKFLKSGAVFTQLNGID